MAISDRRFVSQLGENETVSQVFMASDKQLRPNRSGNLYLQVSLSDRSGSIDARMWNAAERDYLAFENGDFVQVQGSTQRFQGNLQLIANHIRKAPEHEVQEGDFVTLVPADVDKLSHRMVEILRGIETPHLKNLAECFIADDELMSRFATAPAAMKNHHAYRGGLIEHVVNLMEVALRIADRYPQVDTEMLLIGILLHDIGKVVELAYERDISYTDEGQLLGHIVLGTGMLDQKVQQYKQLTGQAFPDDVLMELKHLIISHHGQYDYGSPRLPMTLEAIALHHLDNLDAKIHSFDQLIRDNANVGSPWTHYHANLGRKLYKRAKS